MAARWHPHDLTILRVSWYRGDPGGDIAARLGRSKQAVLTMRWVLRLPLSRGRKREIWREPAVPGLREKGA